MTVRFDAASLGAALLSLGLAPDRGLFVQLCDAYGEDHRVFHTTRHIEACLVELDAWQALAEHVAEVAVALWFHDAVYDTHRSDNESRSAAWARDYLLEHGADAGIVTRVEALILSTRTHDARSGDEALMTDIDLAILGAPAATFEEYDRAIRSEYAWVPEPQYREARARLLKGFLDRADIYRNEPFRRRYEVQARDNLARKVAELER